MPYCKNCGAEISEEQKRAFNSLCSDCIRLVKFGKRSGGLFEKEEVIVLLDSIKTIKVRFFIGIILVMVYISKIIYDILWDLEVNVYATVVPYTLLLIISILTNIIGILIFLIILKRLIKMEKLNARIEAIIFLCTGVVIVILPTGYYISYRLGLLSYGNAYIIFLVGRLFNYFYIIGIALLLTSLILLLRKN